MTESPVLSATRLQYEYVGPATKKAKGWAVTDDSAQLVATVPQPTGFSIGIPEYPLVDASGTQLALVVPGEQKSNTHRIEQAHVGTYDGDFQRTDYDVVDANNATLIHISIGTDPLSITGVTITDVAGAQVATIEQRNEKISFLKGRTSFVLQRQEGLTDPVRMLVVIAPLLIHLDFELRELRSNTGRGQRDWRPL